MKKLILFTFLATILLTSCSRKTVYATTTPAKVVVVKKAPSHHKVVIIKGRRYYKWNGKHYRKTRKGFVLVRV